MFSLSQLVLRYSNFCKESSISSYSIAIGVMLYASIYLYLLFYYHDILTIFNKFIIYIISVDLLVSIFLHMNNVDSDSKNESTPNNQLDDEINNDDQLSESDESLTTDLSSSIAESDVEVHSCEDFELNFPEQIIPSEQIQQDQPIQQEQIQQEQIHQEQESNNTEQNNNNFQKQDEIKKEDENSVENFVTLVNKENNDYNQ